MAKKKFQALVRFEHDGGVTKAGDAVTLPYGSDRDREYADGLVRSKVLAEHTDGEGAPARRKR